MPIHKSSSKLKCFAFPRRRKSAFYPVDSHFRMASQRMKVSKMGLRALCTTFSKTGENVNRSLEKLTTNDLN